MAAMTASFRIGRHRCPTMRTTDFHIVFILVGVIGGSSGWSLISSVEVSGQVGMGHMTLVIGGERSIRTF